MKSITLEQIMSLNPCNEYPRKRIEALMAGRASVTALDVLNEAENLDGLEDVLWLILRHELLDDATLHRVGIYATKLILPIYEKRYPEDDRPRKAIQAKKDWLKGKITDEQLAEASAAAWDAVCAEASAAARAEARAAKAVAWAARAVAWAASDAACAVNAAFSRKIIDYIKEAIE